MAPGPPHPVDPSKIPEGAPVADSNWHRDSNWHYADSNWHFAPDSNWHRDSNWH
ncbi:hypothetical protein GCM10023200_24520 [Actinomycetospora chlora]|uniref:Uncharacterized protein n=1 Tax=Actinomycetospora chlora TaxID=663608 RepID=A0ABP9B439_9PSEU